MIRILVGDCREKMRLLDADSVHAIVTSPPYWNLRDYGCGGQIGLEIDFRDYIEMMVAVFREARRVLRADGTAWINLGDCYANDGKWGGETGGKQRYLDDRDRKRVGREKRVTGLKPKDMCAIPWRVALALQADGWWLRKALPWVKRNPLPESVNDRPSTAVEYVFQLAKSDKYFWDSEAVARKASPNTHARISQDVASQIGGARAHAGGKTNGNMKAVVRRPKSIAPGQGVRANESYEAVMSGAVLPTRNWRDADLFFDSLVPPHGLICDADFEPLGVDATTQAFKGAHFATFPQKLVEPLIRASTKPGDIVLDMFAGAGTTGLVSAKLGRDAILIELNPSYAEMARQRLASDGGMFCEVVVEAPPRQQEAAG